MNNFPLVSVIMPTYNHAKFIEQAIISVLNQTYKNFEIIIIDNNSNDNTQAIVKKYKKNYKIRSFLISNDGVIGKSRNYGIIKAKGNFVAFLDSDDYWYSNKLEICINNLNQGYDFVYHELALSKDKISLHRKIKSHSLSKPQLKNLLVEGNPIATSSVVVKKNILMKVGLFNESKKMIGSEDYNLWLKLAKNKIFLQYINQQLGIYTYHDMSISKKNMSYSMWNASKCYYKFITKNERLKAFALIKYTYAKYCFTNKKYHESIKIFSQIFIFLNVDKKIKIIYMFLVGILASEKN